MKSRVTKGEKEKDMGRKEGPKEIRGEAGGERKKKIIRKKSYWKRKRKVMDAREAKEGRERTDT